jgi:hypothetical protein
MSWQLFDRISAFFKTTNIYRSENLFTDQSSLARISAAGEFLNFSTQHSLLEQTNLQINRLERYKDFDQEDQVGEISAALDMYADEASLIDPEIHHSLLIKAKSLRVKKELEDFFYNTLMVDNMLRPAVRYLCKYGDFPAEIIPTQNRNGIASIRHMNVYNFTRVETKFGDLVGFFYQDEMTNQPTFFHPWQIMHLRLTSYENIYHPYGRSILDATRKHFKQLRLMEDAALIYRLTRAPEKRIFKIPVGNIPTKEVPQYIQLIAREFKKNKIFDSASGDVSERWSPLLQEDDFWLPKRPDGSGPEVDTLPGAENLDQIADIEYFKKKMVSALKIPFSRVGIGEPSEGDSQPLSKVAPEFAKAVQWIQREVVTGLKKIAIVHLALRGFAADDIRGFDLFMTASSAIDELYRIETWASRADVIDALKGTGLFPSRWLLQRFTNMTDDEIDQMQDEAKKKGEVKFGEGEGGGGGVGPIGADVNLGAPTPGGPPDLEEVPKGAEGEEGQVPLGAPGEELPGGQGELFNELPVEGYDYEKEKQVLNEYRNQKGNIKRPITEYYNGFDYLISTGELDNLPGPNNEPQVRSVLTEGAIKEAISEAKTVLTQDAPKVISEDITVADLPN